MLAKQRLHQHSLFIVAAMFALTTSCSKPPNDEVAAVHRALEEARQAETATYAPEELQQAETAVARMDAEIQAQEEKFALTRSYRSAVQLASEAQEAIEKAQSDALAAKEQARADAKAALSEARTALDTARSSLESAPVGKGSKMDIAALKADLSDVAAAIEEASRTYQQGQYLKAQVQAEAAKDIALKAQEDLDSARANRQST